MTKSGCRLLSVFLACVVWISPAGPQTGTTNPPPRQKALSLLTAGVNFARSGRFAEAAEQFLRALALDPKLAEAHYNLGLVRLNWKDLGAAIDSFESALGLNPRYALAQIRLADARTALARERGHGWDEAIDAYRRALHLGVDKAEAHFNLAYLELQKGNQQAAVTGYREVLRLDPHYPGALLNLAVSLYETGLYEEARDILSDLAAREPGSASVRHYFGLTLLKRGEAELALPELRMAVDLQRDNPESHYALGQALRRLGRAEEAAEAMHAAGRLRAGSTEQTREQFLEGQAQQLAQAGDLDAAADKLRDALAVNGNDRIALNLGMLLVRKGDFDKAIDVLGELSRANPDLPLPHYHLGLAFARTRDLAQARKSFETAVRLRPSFPEALFNLGLACAMQGATEEAETHLRASISQQPDHAASRYYLGLVLRQLGRDAEAEAEMRIARLLDPGLSDDP